MSWEGSGEPVRSAGFSVTGALELGVSQQARVDPPQPWQTQAGDPEDLGAGPTLAPAGLWGIQNKQGVEVGGCTEPSPSSPASHSALWSEHRRGARPVLCTSQHLGIDSSALLEAVGVISLLYVRADGGSTERLSGLPKSHS